jgi:hypothetical protein
MKQVSQPDVNKCCHSYDMMGTNSPVTAVFSVRHCVLRVVIVNSYVNALNIVSI